MIAKLRGVVDSVGDGWAVVDVSGVGYRVFCSGRTLAGMVEGEAVCVLIETHIREDHIHLYGFSDDRERECYRLLTTVQGVGAKVGLAILTVMGADEVVTAIASGDSAALTRAVGVGARLAGRIISELKDKLATIPGTVDGAAEMSRDDDGDVRDGDRRADAVSALANLGYNPSDAFTAVSRVVGEFGDDLPVEELIRGALVELATRS